MYGLCWFLCLPLLVLLAALLPPYRRHQLVAGGSIFVQLVALAFLATLLSESSSYHRMSSLAHMGQELPAFSGLTARPRLGTKVAVD